MPRPALLSWLRRRHRQAAVLVMRHPLVQRVPPGRRILEVLDLVPDAPTARLAPPRPRFYPGFLLETDALPPAPLLSSLADALDRALSLDGALDAMPSPPSDESEQRPLIRAAASDAPTLQSAPMVEALRPPPPAATPAPPATWDALGAESVPPRREYVAPEATADDVRSAPAPFVTAEAPSVSPPAPALERVELPPTLASPPPASAPMFAAPETSAAATKPSSPVAPTVAESMVAASTPPAAAPPSPALPLTAEARLIAAVREVFAHERAREGIAPPAPTAPPPPDTPPMVAAPEPAIEAMDEPVAEPLAEAPVELPMPSPAEPAAPSPPALAFEQRQARRPPGAREGAPPPRPPRPPDLTPPASAPALFTPPEDPRAPLDWLKRLVEATSSSAPAAPAASSPARPTTPPAAATRHRPPPATPRPLAPPVAAPPAPTPLAPSTRRFLRPLIGIDPDSVRVHRGPLADAVTTAHGADALTVGDDIVLASGQDERSPETLGLLAHELTHVARQRSPRFVPPVAQGTAARRAESHATSTLADEETLARHVESEVRAAATAPPMGDAEASMSEVSYALVGGGALGDAPHGAVRHAPASPPWGSLPAPWEPMPMSAPAEVPPSVSAPVSAPMFAPSPSAASEVSVPIPVQLAEEGRSVEAAEHPAEQHQKGSAHGAPPDIDALARQVYDVLKRRLAAERRRHS